MQNSKLQKIYCTVLTVFSFVRLILWLERFIYVNDSFVLLAQGDAFNKQFSQSLVELFVQFVNTVYQHKICPVGSFQKLREDLLITLACIFKIFSNPNKKNTSFR